MRKTSFMVSTWAFAVFAAILFTPGPSLLAENEADPLNGKTFVGEIGEKGKTTSQYKEEMSFKDGVMVSSACSSLGFESFSYTATNSDDGVHFVAEATNPTEGTLTWEGVVNGDALDATSVWEKPGNPPDESWLKATLKD